MTELRALLAQVGRTEASVLITGPSGSGKELAARALHAASPRSRGPFVALNCGAIPRELLESELFGHERGAFTGAHQMRVGKFEAAAGGTLFLDEIGDMPLDMQVALLRVIEEWRFERIGSAKSQVANVRIVSATHRDPGMAILAGRFREDLYYRLNVFPIQIPALTERREDVTDLIEHFTAPLGARAPMFADDGIARLVAHDWPGNVRELRSAVFRAVVMCSGGVIQATDLSLAPSSRRPPTVVAAAAAPDRPRRHAIGRETLVAALREQGHNVTAAAATLGVSRVTFYRLLQRFEVTLDRADCGDPGRPPAS